MNIEIILSNTTTNTTQKPRLGTYKVLSAVTNPTTTNKFVEGMYGTINMTNPIRADLELSLCFRAQRIRIEIKTMYMIIVPMLRESSSVSTTGIEPIAQSQHRIFG
jgi:hypothetical protein